MKKTKSHSKHDKRLVVAYYVVAIIYIIATFIITAEKYITQNQQNNKKMFWWFCVRIRKRQNHIQSKINYYVVAINKYLLL